MKRLSFFICLLFLGCSSSNEAVKWELMSHKMFAKNIEFLMKIDSLERELENCNNIKKLMVKK